MQRKWAGLTLPVIRRPNKRVVVGRASRVAPDQERRLAQELLGRVAAGNDPAGE